MNEVRLRRRARKKIPRGVRLGGEWGMGGGVRMLGFSAENVNKPEWEIYRVSDVFYSPFSQCH